MPLAWIATLIMATALTTPTLDSLLRSRPADSLVVPLRRFENEHARLSDGAQAALMLGHLHYARGEYLLAAGAFTRAAARLAPDFKPEARYWAGLSWLALGEPAQARSALEEVATSTSARRAEAAYAIAWVWELQQRPERAAETLERLLAETPGEVGAAALEKLTELNVQLKRTPTVETTHDRLQRDYPRSIEAARAPAAPTPAEPPTQGVVAVQIGVFSKAARANTLRDAARRAGFAAADVVVHGSGATRVHAVRLGVFPNADEAKRAGERATQQLGVTYMLVSGP